ncbi:hypothetical protein D3C84_849040 [compost metagenome]
MGRHAQVDAIVRREVVWDDRLGMPGEIRRRAHHRHAHVRADAQGNHVLGHLRTQPHTGVETLRDDIGKAVVDDDFDVEVGMIR